MKQKLVFKSMYVLFTLVMVGSSSINAQSKSTRSTPGTAIFVMKEIDSIQIERRDFHYTKDNLDINIQLPQFKVANNAYKALNKSLIIEAKQTINNLIKENKQLCKESKRDMAYCFPIEYQQNYREIETIEPYHTIEIFKYIYRGGAHGLPEVDYLTVNTSNEQLLQLKDLFRANVDYQAIINKYIGQQLVGMQQKGEVFSSIDMNKLYLIKENHPFYITPNHDLVVIFNVYEIAPYSAGIIYVSIPYESLKPYMK